MCAHPTADGGSKSQADGQADCVTRFEQCVKRSHVLTQFQNRLGTLALAKDVE